MSSPSNRSVQLPNNPGGAGRLCFRTQLDLMPKNRHGSNTPTHVYMYVCMHVSLSLSIYIYTYESICINIYGSSCELTIDTPSLKLMNLISALGQAVAVTREALGTNLWGLGCPLHCYPSSIPLIALTFLVGIITGAFLLGFAIFWISHLPLHPTAPPPPVILQPSIVQRRRRLEGYSPSLDGGAQQ